ncbi:hypothetical protein GCM10010289_78690 [Streptomyces violascens]|uniref:Uncharacterized protein n=1 Tax=Streptomyces violascens TaxID=67381 RepID=A0ABQ3R167_9ACTN|nr:hypothetical protein GCM10010289_78690 [Streptomyces violascens]GHI43257.1 hypothetical protein Sviol_76650 [Streptomyces violascens]GHI43268.1 hypothetical protein Sviol_76760 [Streptomyces violascens]
MASPYRGPLTIPYGPGKRALTGREAGPDRMGKRHLGTRPVFRAPPFGWMRPGARRPDWLRPVEQCVADLPWNAMELPIPVPF